MSRASSVDREADEDGESSSNQDSGAATPTKIKVRVSVVSFLSFGFSHFALFAFSLFCYFDFTFDHLLLRYIEHYFLLTRLISIDNHYYSVSFEFGLYSISRVRLYP